MNPVALRVHAIMAGVCGQDAVVSGSACATSGSDPDGPLRTTCATLLLRRMMSASVKSGAAVPCHVRAEGRADTDREPPPPPPRHRDEWGVSSAPPRRLV